MIGSVLANMARTPRGHRGESAEFWGGPLMSRQRMLSPFHDQRGIALPVAMMVLVLLTSLIAAFVSMSATEPLITATLKAGNEALGLAEAGIDRALWGLGNPAAPAGGQLSNNPPPAAPYQAPYDGSQLIAFARGGYTMSITAPPVPGGTWACVAQPLGSDDRCVVATGSVVRPSAPVPASPGAIPQADLAGWRIPQVALTAIRRLDPA